MTTALQRYLCLRCRGEMSVEAIQGLHFVLHCPNCNCIRHETIDDMERCDLPALEDTIDHRYDGVDLDG